MWRGYYEFSIAKPVRAARFRGHLVENAKYLHGSQTGQTEIQTVASDVIHRIDEGIRAGHLDGAAFRIEVPYSDEHRPTEEAPGQVGLGFGGGVTTEVSFRTVARNDTTTSESGLIDMDATDGEVQFWSYSGASRQSSPLLKLTDGFVEVGQDGTPSSALEVYGDFDSLEYVNLDVWQPDGVGAIRHEGEASITGTWNIEGSELNLPTGTPVIENLSVEFVNGYSWPDQQASDTGSGTIDATASDFEVAATTAFQDGEYEITGTVNIVIGSGDTSSTFTVTLTGCTIDGEIKAKASGAKQTLSLFGRATLSSSDPIEMQIQKDSGSTSAPSSTTYTGFINANWVAS